MTRPRLLLALGAAVPLALVLSACGSGSSEPRSYEDSPLGAYLSSAYGGDLSPEEQERTFAEQQQKMEELIVACMSAEGFEYKPNPVSSVSFTDADEWDPESREWVSQYGYGIVDYPGKPDPNEPIPEEDVWEDVNQAYVESLSPSEQTAYYETLYGAPPAEVQEGEEVSYEYRWEEAGCQGAAQHEAMGDADLLAQEFAPLMEKMNTFYMDLQNDPGFAELDAAWASCMADAGHPGFAKQSEPTESLYEEQNKKWEEAYADSDNPEEVDADLILDEEFREKEITLALADLDCREKTQYRDKSLELQFAAEERFIADNKAELDAFKAAAEQQGAR